MATKPSEKHRRILPSTDLNLTSFMDIITNLMFFLLMFVNIFPIAMIDAPLPKVASTAEEAKLAKDETNKLDLNIFISSNGFVVRSVFGSQSIGLTADRKYQFDQLHKFLMAIHQKQPKAKEVTLTPSDDTKYDTIIQTMDAAREYVKGDPGFKDLPPEIAQKPEALEFNRMFPDVNIGGV